MNVLYLSSLLPNSVLGQVYTLDPSRYVYAPQIFHRNIVDGLKDNGNSVRVLSTLPPCVHHDGDINEKGIQYHFIKYKSERQKFLLVFFAVIKSILCEKSFKPEAVICDTLNATMCIGALISRLFKKIPFVAIVTDLPNSVDKYDKHIKAHLSSFVSAYYINSFDRYILLTQQMNEVINLKKKPFIIMEGICDQSYNIMASPADDNNKVKKRKLLYAGGRPSKDGVDILVAAFKRLDYFDLQLDIFGPMPEDVIGIDKSDNRVIYHGKTENSIIVKAESEAMLLINPRPTEEEYTKYSFPSKIMEYMATGVPMVTTRLAGIPDEYYNYVFTFNKYDVNDYYHTLKSILDMNEQELHEKGEAAKQFVLTKKNKKVQTARIVELIKFGKYESN